MQWPPTKPGLNGKKFHLLPAAFKTSSVLIFNFLKRMENSLIKAIFKSLWVFSITFAASATLILGVKYVPAEIIHLYKLSISLAISLVEPLVIFVILLSVFTLSPGLILSGLYPQKKSILNFNWEAFSKIGTQNSSVHPG